MEEILEVVDRTIILGKEINLYRSIENPLFLAKDVADWIDYAKNKNGSRQTSKMVKMVDENEKLVVKILPPNESQVRKQIMLTEDGLYECCMKSSKPIAKEMKQEIKKYLKSIRLTGAAIPVGQEEKMVNYYFSNLSQNLQGQIVSELMLKNKELQQMYDDLMNTDGLISVNTCAKELGIGEYKLFEFLRKHKVFFYSKERTNVPYERFRKEGKFVVKETIGRDGVYRPVTYITKKGLEYIRKMLWKCGYYKLVLNN